MIDMHAAVIGAGIGGLTAAIGLQRAGADVTVLERAGGPAFVGSGLSLFGNAFTALDAVGVGDEVRALGRPHTDLRAGQRRPDGRWLSVTPPEAIRDLRVMHRADLHRVLAGALRPGTIRYGTPVDTDPVGFDLVVAADGLRSRTRASWPGDPGVRYRGYSTWRGVTATPVDLRGAAGETLGRGERFGLVPLADGRVYWFAVASMPLGRTFGDDYAEVRRRFAGWHEPIAEVIAATAAQTVVRTPIFDLAAPVPAFRRGRTVLLGDAAHAMTPDLGQGAGQAMEDAATLVRLLASAPVDRALDAYDRLRRARTAPIAARARRIGRLMQSRSRWRDPLLRLVPPAIVARQSTRLQAWQPPAPPRRPADRPDPRQDGRHGVRREVR
jgi:2-polyprenyl-6-methoxyphenol hydroxylase-like FAD-dependent oxidoreductase